eukprot:1147806-Pelagomonas_calceolata.AAC.4
MPLCFRSAALAGGYSDVSGPCGETHASLLVRETFLNERGLLAGVDFSDLFLNVTCSKTAEMVKELIGKCQFSSEWTSGKLYFPYRYQDSSSRRTHSRPYLRWTSTK